jgi:mannosyl-3-phosphoglycerate phosphatase
VIPCTSKTAAEVRRFRRAAGLHDPYIVENGGAVHGPDGPDGGWRLVLGCPGDRLRSDLAGLAADTGVALRPLADCSLAEVTRVTGLEGEAARLAREREWSMPFLLPSLPAGEGDRLWRRLAAAARRRGRKLVRGNRMGHLIDAATDKGRALEALRQRWGGGAVRVLALGDSPNDLDLLDAAQVAVVVPGPHGPHPALRAGIATGRYRLAPAPHGLGWAAAVTRWLG